MSAVPNERDVLVLGFGNPGRQDDGLGPAFTRKVDALKLSGVSVQDNYQLSVEDAYDIAQFKTVVFADASIEPINGYQFSPLASDGNLHFGSHSLSPSAVVELSRTLYDAQPDAYILAIKGFEFDRFEEKLSSAAEKNLSDALAFFSDWIGSREQSSAQLKEL